MGIDRTVAGRGHSSRCCHPDAAHVLYCFTAPGPVAALLHGFTLYCNSHPAQYSNGNGLRWLGWNRYQQRQRVCTYHHHDAGDCRLRPYPQYVFESSPRWRKQTRRSYFKPATNALPGITDQHYYCRGLFKYEFQ